ncbi:MAG: helix-turn-helix domain-containing protein [Candidatus Peribacteraceae bacterium]|nr:helix-turn-helix domain-containing protein [Candidatus Peribacteraceae bacterium]
MLSQYLQKLGFDEKDTSIYLSLAEMGIQPASVIARKCGLDRVTVYKHLKRLVDRGFIKVYVQRAVQCFGIESYDQLRTYLEERTETDRKLLSEFDTALSVLKSLCDAEALVPRLRIFEGESGIKAFFRDLLFEASEQKIRQVRMLTSNTFDERLGDRSLARYVREFYSDMRGHAIDLDVIEATGTLVPERLENVRAGSFDPDKFPASRGTTNIFLVGSAVYLACYRDTPIGLKIQHREMAQMFHFLFDMLEGRMSAVQ